MGSCSLIWAPLKLLAKLFMAHVGAGDRGIMYVPGGVFPVLLEQSQAHVEFPRVSECQKNLECQNQSLAAYRLEPGSQSYGI